MAHTKGLTPLWSVLWCLRSAAGQGMVLSTQQTLLWAQAGCSAQEGQETRTSQGGNAGVCGRSMALQGNTRGSLIPPGAWHQSPDLVRADASSKPALLPASCFPSLQNADAGFAGTLVMRFHQAK